MTLPGWAIPLPIVLPNLLLLVFPPRQAGPAGASAAPPGSAILAVVESVTRVAVLALPLFLRFTTAGPGAWAWSAAAALALAVYYGTWARFFLHGRGPWLLYLRLGRLPVPLAIAPVVYFTAAAGIAGSPLYALVVGAFAGAHIRLSLQKSWRPTPPREGG